MSSRDASAGRPLRGLMMDRPLLIASLLRHAARYHGAATISSRFGWGGSHRYTYADAEQRAQRLANVLRELGVRQGDRVGTIAWNDHRHFELYHAVPGIGAICHTINPRLPADHLAYIINHAADRWLFVDPLQVPLVESIWPRLRTVCGVVALAPMEQMPSTTLPLAHCYENLMTAAPAQFDWPEFDERSAAGLCYTSGTTGRPKGVLYSHRSTVLHAYGCLAVPGCALRAGDTALIVVPLFHANAWGAPHVGPLIGANLVLPGPKLDGASLHELMETEHVTISAGVPSVWSGLLHHLRSTGARLSTVRVLTSGGSALPRPLLEEFEQVHGIAMYQGWGMTETSPVATLASVPPDLEQSPAERRQALKLTAGRAVYGVELDVVAEDGARLPHDGLSQGEIVIRGPWIAQGYFRDRKASRAALTPDGWFRTGDVGTLDERGFLRIVDRAKDLVKSGGEWISSAAIEQIALTHPAVSEAAAVGVAHTRWQERPVLIVVPRGGADVPREQLLELLAASLPRWWLPDDVIVVDRLPYTATGKVRKSELRHTYANHLLEKSDVERR